MGALSSRAVATIPFRTFFDRGIAFPMIRLAPSPRLRAFAAIFLPVALLAGICAMAALDARAQDPTGAPAGEVAAAAPRYEKRWEELPFQETQANSCLFCHQSIALHPGLPAREHVTSAHYRAGVTCVDCHGGDPNADEEKDAHNEAMGWKGRAEEAVLTVTASEGAASGMLVAMDGKTKLAEVAIEKMTVEGENATFSAEMSVRGRAVEVAFAGKLSAESLEGVMRANSEGVRLEIPVFAPVRKPAPNAPAAPAGTVAYEGRAWLHLERAKMNESCAKCHPTSATQFAESSHDHEFDDVRQLFCIDCHGAHDVGARNVDFSWPATCAECHTREDLPALPEELASLLSSKDEMEGRLRKLRHRLNNRPYPADVMDAYREVRQIAADIVHTTRSKNLGPVTADAIAKQGALAAKLGELARH